MLLLRLAAYVLWIPGGFAVIAAVILPVVGSGLSRRSRDAAPWPRVGCAQVVAGTGPLHVHGTSAPGPRGLLPGRLSGAECVWYRERVLRRYMVTRIRYTSDDWMEVDEEVEEGGEPRRYQTGPLGVLLGESVLPRDLLDQFAGPGARTTGYRVCEDILRPGLAFHVFAVPGDLDGRPMMAERYQDVWSVSASPMPAALAQGGRRAKAWALRFGVAGVARFAASALLLMRAGHPPG